ncbi:MAG: CHRD domain-containing protein [Pseudomonadota bacterium]|nr:CHRD domain-containing protein [Pseudomonadota bacterium]
MKKQVLFAAAIAAGLFAASSVFADTLTFTAKMDGASETPPTDSKGTATADVKVDTAAKTISWTIKSADLTGPATMAHFHGPAAVGVKAPPEIDISKSIDSGTSPITDAQLADLQAGKLYLNIHTAKFPDGEIRGQVVK